MAFEDYCSPILDEFYITSPWGWRIHPIRQRRQFHAGIDINNSSKNGSLPVYAIKNGEVRSINKIEKLNSQGKGVGGGCYITIWHENDGEVPGLDSGTRFYTSYLHLKQGTIPEGLTVGSKISKGQQIGIVGNSGASQGYHLHFEIRKDASNTIDPKPFLEKYSQLQGPKSIGGRTRVVYKGISPEQQNNTNPEQTEQNNDSPIPTPAQASPPQNVNINNERKIKTGIKKPENLEKVKEAVSDEDLRASLIGFYFPQIITQRNIFTEPDTLVHLTTGEKTTYAHNLLFGNSPDGSDFSLLSSLDLSNMVPYAEMSIIRRAANVNAGSNYYEFINYPFDDYTNQVKLESIFADKTGRGGNIGIESVDWKTIATNPSNKNQVQVSLKIRIQDIQEIETQRNGISLLDFLYPAGTRNDEFDHDNFNVKIKVGWLYKRENNQSIPDIDKKINEDFLSETILVSLYKHSFEFERTGTVILSLEYIGMLESKLKSIKDFDVLECLNPESKSIQNRIKSLQFVIDQLNNPTYETVNILKSTSLHGIFINTAYDNNQQYTIRFTDQFGKVTTPITISEPQAREVADPNLLVINRDTVKDAKKEAERILPALQKKLKESYFPGLKNLLSSIPISYLSITNEQKSVLKQISTFKPDLVDESNFQKFKENIKKASIKKSQIKNISVSKEQIEGMFFTQQLSYDQEVVKFIKKNTNKYLNAVPDFMSTKARFVEGTFESAISKTETFISSEKLLEQLIPPRKDKNIAEQVAYTYLGDILGFYMSAFRDNRQFHEMDFFQIVGEFSYRDIGDLAIDKKNTRGESKFTTSDTLYFSDGTPYKKYGLEKKYSNILNIPISIDSIVNWYNTHVVDNSKEKMSLLDFIKNIFNNVVPANLTNQILDYGNKRKILISNNFLTLSKQDTKIDELFLEILEYKEAFSELISQKIKPQAEIDLRDSISQWKFLKRFVPSKDEETQVYNFLFILSAGEKDNFSSDYEEDKRRGIYHFHVGEDSGIIREIKFSKEDNPALDSANIIKANNSEGQKIIRQIYQADIELFGNTIFSPGQLIHVAPTYPGGRLKNKTLYQIGLGGYYRIISIENFIQNGKFETRLKTKWEMHGENITDDISFDGFIRVSHKGFEELGQFSSSEEQAASARALVQSGLGIPETVATGVTVVKIGVRQ